MTPTPYYTPADLVGLPGMPVTLRSVHRWISRTQPETRPRVGRGGGVEVHIDSLPTETRLHLFGRALSDTTYSYPPLVPNAQQARADDQVGLGGTHAQRLHLARLDIVLHFNEFVGAVGARYASPSAASISANKARAFIAAYNKGQIPVQPATRATLGETLSVRSLHRYLAAHRSGGEQALKPSGQDRKFGVILRNPDIAQFIERFILEVPHAKSKVIHEAIEAQFGTVGANNHSPNSRDSVGAQLAAPGLSAPDSPAIPSLRSVQLYIQDFRARNQSRITLHANPDAHRNKFMPAFGSLYVSTPNERWEIDGTVADILCRDNRRYHLVGLIDVATKRFKLRVVPTSKAAEVMALVREAILDWGLPNQIKSDNGQDYRANDVERNMFRLGITYRPCAHFSPEKKPFIERAIKTFSHDLLELLPGYVGHNVSDRKAIESRKAFAKRLFKKGEVIPIALAPEELQAFCDKWLAGYHHRSHGGLAGKSPSQYISEWSEPIAQLLDLRALDFLLTQLDGEHIRTVAKKGIRIKNDWYWSSTLALHIGEQVACKRNPYEHAYIEVFSTQTGRWLMRCECPELSGKTRADIQAAAEAARRNWKSWNVEERKQLRATPFQLTAVVDKVMDRRVAQGSQINHFPAGQMPVLSDRTAPYSDAARAFSVGAQHAAPGIGAAPGDSADALVISADEFTRLRQEHEQEAAAAAVEREQAEAALNPSQLVQHLIYKSFNVHLTVDERATLERMVAHKIVTRSFYDNTLADAREFFNKESLLFSETAGPIKLGSAVGSA